MGIGDWGLAQSPIPNPHFHSDKKNKIIIVKYLSPIIFKKIKYKIIK